MANHFGGQVLRPAQQFMVLGQFENEVEQFPVGLNLGLQALQWLPVGRVDEAGAIGQGLVGASPDVGPVLELGAGGFQIVKESAYVSYLANCVAGPVVVLRARHVAGAAAREQ